MFGQFSEQMQKSSQPASELLAANVKAVEAITAQQTQFISGLMNDSVKLIQTITQQTEVKGIVAAQSVYAESVRERLTSSSKSTYGTISSVSQQYTDALKASLATPATDKKASTVSKAPAQTAPVAKAAVTKTPVKKAPVKKAPVKSTSAKGTTVKGTTVKGTATKKAAIKKAPLTKETVTKTNVTDTPVAKAAVKKPISKSAAKTQPVASLSAAEVKAPAKTKSTAVKTPKAPDTKA